MSDKEMHEVQEILPDSAAVEKQRKPANGRILLITVLVLTASVAVAVLAAYVWLPVLQIYGKSMTPTLKDGDYVVVLKTTKAAQGDVVALDVNNKLLIRRVIAGQAELRTGLGMLFRFTYRRVYADTSSAAQATSNTSSNPMS